MTRAVLRIQLDGDAKDRLDDFCHSRGMTQIAVTSRLVKWFTQQDEVVQLSILGVLSDKSASELAQALLHKIAHREHIAAEVGKRD